MERTEPTAHTGQALADAALVVIVLLLAVVAAVMPAAVIAVGAPAIVARHLFTRTTRRTP